MDLITTHISNYNTFMKIVYIILTYFTIYLIYGRCFYEIEQSCDTFDVKYILIPALVFSLIANHFYSFLEVSEQNFC